MMLEVADLHAGYGKSEVLHGVSLALQDGELLALLGRNGMGKSTTLNTVMGLLPVRSGRITIAAWNATGASPTQIARRGVGYVPEGRRIFPNLTARENLLAVANGDRWTVDKVLALFPPLAARLDAMGNLLSGGEQQMLAIGRALMTNPRLLILDEATEGLAPLIRRTIWTVLETLAAEGLTILVVDKNLDQILPLAAKVVVLERGAVAWSGTGAAANLARGTIEGLISVR